MPPPSSTYQDPTSLTYMTPCSICLAARNGRFHHTMGFFDCHSLRYLKFLVSWIWNQPIRRLCVWDGASTASPALWSYWSLGLVCITELHLCPDEPISKFWACSSNGDCYNHFSLQILDIHLTCRYKCSFPNASQISNIMP